jgi:hypothetical protein
MDLYTGTGSLVQTIREYYNLRISVLQMGADDWKCNKRTITPVQ